MARTNGKTARKSARRKSQLREDQLVKACAHAWQRADERRSPVHYAMLAVNRNLSKLRQVCTKNGSRAALDYHDGIAIVQLKGGGRFQIVTILGTWMSPGNQPIVIDGATRGIAQVDQTRTIREQHAREKIQAAVLAYRASLTVAGSR